MGCRFAGGVDPKAKFLSHISQPKNYWSYILICLAITTVVYLGIQFALAGIIVLVIIYQTINFHHYVVDGLIWKVRKKSLRETLGPAFTEESAAAWEAAYDHIASQMIALGG